MWAPALLLSTAVYLGLLAVVIALIGADGADRIPATMVRAVWSGAGLGLVAASLISFLLWFGFARRRLLGGRLAACVRAAAIPFAVGGLISAALELRGTDVAVASASATSRWSYSVRADPVRNLLVIKGPVGRRFGAAVEAGLAQLSDPVRVEIDSPGGLIDEALRAGKAIGARPGASVVARHWCASACLIVLMSGEQRLADRRTQVAFHAAAPLAALPDPLFAWSFARQRHAAETYLIDRGAPPDLIDRADRIGPGRVITLTAGQALDRGVLTGILSPNRRDHGRARRS